MKKPESKMRKKSGLDRRSFVKLLPAAGAAGLVVSSSSLKAIAQTPTPLPSPRPSPTPLRITKDMMHNAEKVIGIELTDKQEGMALPGFHIKRAAAKTKFKFGKHEPVQFKSVDDLAFATVPQLADLIRTKKVSSVELTKMYLGRLKRYG